MQTPVGWMGTVMTYFAPLRGVYWLILLIVASDFITGIWASACKRVPQSSKRLRKSLEKLLCYLGVIYLFFEFETRVGIQEWICTYKMVSGFIFVAEIISILENTSIITEHPVFFENYKTDLGQSGPEGRKPRIRHLKGEKRMKKCKYFKLYELLSPEVYQDEDNS